MGGLKATRAVRDYFSQVHGEWGVLLFQVEQVSFVEESKQWVIQCSFWPAPGAPARVVYGVRVSEQGEIVKVEKSATAGA